MSAAKSILRLLNVLKSKNFTIEFQKRILKFSKHHIFDRNSISVYWFLANAINRGKKKKKECEFRLPVKLLSRSFCHFFVSLPPLSRSDAFSFLTLKTCQDEGKSEVAVGGGEGENISGKKRRNEETLALVWRRTNDEQWDR